MIPEDGRVQVTPEIAAAGDRVRIVVAADEDFASPPLVELVKEDDGTSVLTLQATDVKGETGSFVAEFLVDVSFPVGQYSIRVLSDGEWEFDPVTLGIVEEESINQASIFRAGVEALLEAKASKRGGNEQSVREHLQLSAEKHEEAGALELAANSWEELSSSFMVAGLFLESRNAALKARALYERCENVGGVVVALQRIANTYLREGRDDVARDALERATTLSQEEGIAVLAFNSLWSLSDLAWSLRDPGLQSRYCSRMFEVGLSVKGEVDRARVLDLFRRSSKMYRFWGDIAPRNLEWTVRLRIPFEGATSLHWRKIIREDYEPKLLSLGVVGKIAKALILSLEDWVGSQIPSATIEMSRMSGFEHLRLRLRTEGHVYDDLFRWAAGESLEGARFFREIVESIGGTLEAQQKGEELAVEVEVPAIENFSASA